MILAGDIGGTKTNLALFDWKTERVEPAREQTFASADFGSLEDVLARFLKPPVQESAASPGDESSSEPSVSPSTDEPTRIEAACFGVAGPVVENRSRTTNLPWVVDGAELAKRFELPTVRLLNDVEAAAHGVPVLRPDETEGLNAEICVQPLDLFAPVYGAEAGNLALKALALDGVFLGGGIAPKLLAKLKDGTFVRAFVSKGRYKRLMSTIPVRVILNQKTALLAAASVAARLRAEA